MQDGLFTLNFYTGFNNIANYVSKMNIYVNASLIGAMRGGVCLFIEHPLESIKTQWQNKITAKNPKEIVKIIWSEKGLIGFYRGFVPNFFRVTSKQLYRWPMMLFFPQFYQKKLPNKITDKFPGISKILCGLTIANIEIFLLCPLDRLKIYFMTSTNNQMNMLSTFYKVHKGSLFLELFRGLEPTFWRSNVSWVSFLYMDYKFKALFKKHRNNDILSYLDLLYISILVGIGNLILSKYI